MICEVIYGPRLDNDVDHQVLENLADRLLSDSGPDLPKLPSYPEKGRTAANKYISNLPIAQTGEILGLSKNADRSLTESRFDETMGLIIKERFHSFFGLPRQ